MYPACVSAAPGSSCSAQRRQRIAARCRIDQCPARLRQLRFTCPQVFAVPPWSEPVRMAPASRSSGRRDRLTAHTVHVPRPACPLVHKLWPRLRPISACPQRERQHDRKSLAQRLLSQIHARECNPVQFTVSVILSHTKTSASGRSVASPLLMEPACVEDAIDTVGVVGQSVAAVIGGECRE